MKKIFPYIDFISLLTENNQAKNATFAATKI